MSRGRVQIPLYGQCGVGFWKRTRSISNGARYKVLGKGIPVASLKSFRIFFAISYCSPLLFKGAIVSEGHLGHLKVALRC